MKIAILVNELTVRGGTHKQVHRLSTYLTENGHEIELFTKKYDKNLCYPGIEHFKVHNYNKYFFRTDRNVFFRKILEFKGYLKIATDAYKFSRIINIHDNGFAISQIIIKKTKPKAKIVWQINDLPQYFGIGNSSKYSKSIFNRFGIFSYKQAANLTNKITVNVTKNATRVKEFYNQLAEVVYCGVDLRNKELNHSKNSISIEKLTLLSIGVLFPYRNYETLIKVIEVLKNKHNVNCNGNIIGSTDLAPDYTKSIQLMIEKAGINCKLFGDISENELENIYSNSDIFLFLNKDQSWGLAVFEAMNMGLPVIVSNSVGATEILQDKKHAYIVDPENTEEIVSAILNIIEDKIKTKKLIVDAFNHTINMSWDNMYSKRMLEIFTELNDY